MKGKVRVKRTLPMLLILLMGVTLIANIATKQARAAVSQKELAATYLNATVKNLNFINEKARSFDFDIKQEAQEKGAKYNWYVNKDKGDADVITINSKTGVVTAKKAGTAYICCKITLGDGKVIRPEAKVIVRNNITKVDISNLPKDMTILAGRAVDFNRSILDTDAGKKVASTGITRWEIEGDTAGIIRATDSGEVFPVKEGAFQIRAVCFQSNEKYNIWLKDKEGNARDLTAASKWYQINVKDSEGKAVVSNKEHLEKALAADNLKEITLTTKKDINLTIKESDYSNKTFIVNAPNAEIENFAVFKSVVIEAIKENTWSENAQGNSFHITSIKIRIIVNGQAIIQNVIIDREDTEIEIEIEGTIQRITVLQPAELNLSGDGEQVPITIEKTGKGTSITTSIPLKIRTEGDTKVKVLPGAEGTRIEKTNKDIKVDVENKSKQPVYITSEDGKEEVVKAGERGTSDGSTQPTPSPTPIPSSGDEDEGEHLPPVVALDSIAIKTPASKTVYKVNEALSIAGLTIEGTYSDGEKKTETITTANISGFSSAAVTASQTLTITVGEKTATYIISVIKADGSALTGVSRDDALNTMSGMTAAMEFSIDGSTWKGYDAITPNLPDLKGTVKLYVRYKETDTHTIGTVTEFQFNLGVLESISIKKPADKLVYIVGEALDISGLIIQGNYSDGGVKEETVSVDNITGFDSSYATVYQELTITIGEKVETYTVQVKDTTPVDEYSGITGIDRVTLGSKQITLFIKVSNSANEGISGLSASDFTVDIGHESDYYELIYLNNSTWIKDFEDLGDGEYDVTFIGEENYELYKLYNLKVKGVIIHEECYNIITPRGIRPILQKATISEDGTTIALEFDKAMQPPNEEANIQFRLYFNMDGYYMPEGITLKDDSRIIELYINDSYPFLMNEEVSLYYYVDASSDMLIESEDKGLIDQISGYEVDNQSLATMSISVEPDSLTESTENDGSLKSGAISIYLEHTAIMPSATKNDILAVNLPVGMNYTISKDGSNKIIVNIIGSALNHANINDIDNLHFTLKKEVVAKATEDIVTENISIDFITPPMTGVVSITGSNKYGQTLTAYIADLIHVGTPAYQWLRNGDPITAATEQIYKLSEEDIGKSISVSVTADGLIGSGSITSDASDEILKADGPSLSGVTGNDENDTLIGITPEMEFSIDGGTTWTGYIAEPSYLPALTGDLNLMVRMAETETHHLGEAITFNFTKLMITTGTNGGTVAVSVTPTTDAVANNIYTINISDIEAGKRFKSLTIRDTDTTNVAYTEMTPGVSYSFIMPTKSVTISVEIEVIPTYLVYFSIYNRGLGDGGTLTATVDGVPITNGDRVQEGKNIIFTADPDEEMRIYEWSLNYNAVVGHKDSTYTVSNLTAETVVVRVQFNAMGPRVCTAITYETSRNNICLWFDGIIQDNPVPDASDFTLDGDAMGIEVNSVHLDTESNTCILELTGALTSKANITLRYIPGEKQIFSEIGIPMEAFTKALIVQ